MIRVATESFKCAVAVFRLLLVCCVLIACGAGDPEEKAGSTQNSLVSPDLVIRQVYARSPASAGITGTFSREFIEIRNRGTVAASLSGLTLQAAGSGDFLKSVVLPPVSIPPGKTYLAASEPVDQSPELPVAPDLVWAVSTYSSGGGSSPSAAFLSLQGKVALVRSAPKPLLCGSAAKPCTATQLAKIIDLVGYGTPGTLFEGSGPALALNDAQSLSRKQSGTQDTDQNSSDFTLGTPYPRNLDSGGSPVPGAPALNASTGTTFGDLTGYIYDSGNASAPQTGVAAGTIDPARASWIVGYVKDGTGASNAGVAVTVLGPAGTQYGQATTRADGRFDLVVNGSANFTLRFSKAGFFSADRRVYAGAQLTTSLDDVWLVAADTTSKVLTASSATFQVAAGSTIAADATSAARTPVLMIPKLTTFKLGSTDLTSMTLRLTEYTAGANGINRMPASLTGSPAYTYAVEISADEAVNQGIDFKTAAGADQQVFFYVDDPIGFAVGSAVPSGYYDRSKQAWVASPSGRVIQVVVTNGVATVDIDGGGVDSAATVDAFGIKPDELAALASRYGVAGQTKTTKLWRVPITHMTPYDLNWPVVPPDCEGSVCPGPQGAPPPPSQPQCSGKCCGGASGGGGADGDSQRKGSIIGCDSGMLGETVNVAGTPYSLNYSSYRTPGYADKRQLKIDITGPGTIHSAETLITADVAIAGQTIHREFVPTANLSWTFQWDGLDAAGRSVVGSALANVRIKSYFKGKYTPVSVFGDYPVPTPTNGVVSERAFVSYERRFQVPLMGQVPTGGWSLGDWTLSPHHFYDVVGNTVHLGTGGRIPSALQQTVISRIMGSGGGSTFAPEGGSATATGTGFAIANTNPGAGVGAVAVAPNGDVFVADAASYRIRRIDRAGNIKTVVGSGTAACTPGATTGTPNFADSATDATTSNLSTPTGLAIGSDGSLYIASYWDNVIRKATPLASGKYSIAKFAGAATKCGPATASAVDQAATSATFAGILGVAVGPDDSVYVLDGDGYRVRRIDPATGKISNFAGNGQSGTAPRTSEGKRAQDQNIGTVTDIAVAPNGTVYLAKAYDLLSVDQNGALHFLNKEWINTTTLADGVALSTQVVDGFLESVAVTPSGVAVFNDDDWQRTTKTGTNARHWIRSLSPVGIVTSLSSTADLATGRSDEPLANGLATGNGPPRARNMAAAPNGDVLVMSNNSVYRISPARLPDTTPCADATVKYLVLSGDSGFCFDSNGRHKKTIDVHTGQALYTFGYNAAGVLRSVADPGGRITYLVVSNGNYVISPPAPGDVNQKTTVTITNGHASNISDNIGSFKPTALASGLLSQLVDGETNTFTFTYDTNGFLATDASPLGTQTLSRQPLAGNGKKVTLTSPLGVKTIFETTLDATNLLTHKTTFPDLTTELKTKTPNGVDETTTRDGTKITATTKVETQLNGQIPVQALKVVKLPSGATMTTLRSFSDPAGGPSVETIKFDNSATPPTQTTTTTYSASGKTVVITSPENRTRTIKSDGTGHITQRKVGTLTPTDFTYVNGQLATATQGARSTNYSYVSTSTDVDAGYLYQITDTFGTTEIRRNLRGQPLSEEVALGTAVASKTTYTWFKNDLLNTVRTPNWTAQFNAEHWFAYNAVKELSQYLPPSVAGVSAPATNYTYTADRDLWTEQPSGLSAMTRTYISTTGQLDTISLPATSLSGLAGTVDYDYFTTNDSATGAAGGQVSQITGPTAGNTLAFKYDGSLKTSQTWAGEVAGQVTWLYNSRFWPKQESIVTTATFNRFFGYDNDGLLVCNSPTTCNPAGADALKITHSTIHGGVTFIDQGGSSGAQETWSYSDTVADQTATPKAAFGELREQSATVGGTVVADIVYDAASERRDNSGRIRFKTETFRDATGAHNSVTKKYEYVYDERGQLKSVYLGGAASGTLIYDATYDKNGNRKDFKTSSGGPLISCAVDAQDRLSNCGTTTFTYYDNGEVKTKVNGLGTWTYHYDALRRLRRVVKTGGNTYDYVIDGEGRRIAKKVNGTIQKRWLYGAGLSPIAELDSTGAVVARYVYGSRKNTPDLVITRQLVNAVWVETTYRLISDSLGTPRYAVNVTNKDDVKYQVSYSPLGVPTADGGLAASTISWIPFGFAGGLYDSDTGLVHFGAREYDPEVGRWTSKDPIRFDGGDVNLYRYVGNDPINQTDPLGLMSQADRCKWFQRALTLFCTGTGAWVAVKNPILGGLGGAICYMVLDELSRDPGGVCAPPKPQPECDPSSACCSPSPGTSPEPDPLPAPQFSPAQ